MSLIKKYVLTDDDIDIRSILIDVNNFRKEIESSILRGESTYLPNASAKEIAAYKNPESEQSVRGVLAWNMLNPLNQIEFPSKVGLLKLNIFNEEDIEPLKNEYPDIYNTIMDKIFNDTTGIFVTKTIDPGIGYVNVKKSTWYEDIPKKYRAKYKKPEYGPEAWNSFVDSIPVEKLNCPGGLSEASIIKKVRGMQVLAIPNNAKIPEWIQPYIDYPTIINNTISPFQPVLEIFKSKTIVEGKTYNGVDRKSNSFTNIIKF